MNKQLTQKQIVIAFACLAGFFLIYWIFISSPLYITFFQSSDVSENKKENTTSSSQGSPTSLVKHVESLESLLSGIEPSTQSGSSLQSASSSNLTQNLVNTLEQQLFSTTWDGSLSTSSAQNILGQIDTQKITESLSGNSLSLGATIRDDQLTIIQGASQEDIKAYSDAYVEIILPIVSTLFHKSSMNEMISLSSSASNAKLQLFVSAIKDSLIKLYSLRVPQQYVSFHKKNIVFVSDSFKVFSAILYYQTDPIKANVGLESITTLLKEWEEIRKDLILAN